MSHRGWKCCKNCRCPCKNNDICPDTAAQIISEGKQNIFDSSLKSKESESSSSGPTLDDLIHLEKKIDERLKRIPKISDLENSSPESQKSSDSSIESRLTPTDSQLYMNEIYILRKKLQTAELKNAIIEEKVERLENEMSFKSRGSVSVQQINLLKQQILAFIEEKFSQLLRNNFK